MKRELHFVRRSYIAILKFPVFTIIASLLTACVVIPINRTYYEPNPADGIPSKSSSCGYHSTAEDMLRRDVDGNTGIILSVLPSQKEGQPLSVYLLISKSTFNVTIDPEKLGIRFEKGEIVRPATTTMKDAGPNFLKSINYVFPKAFSANEIAVVFYRGFININGHEIDIAPFRFKKITKPDIYYGSINC